MIDECPTEARRISGWLAEALPQTGCHQRRPGRVEKEEMVRIQG